MKTVCVIPMLLMMEPEEDLRVYTLCWRRVERERSYFHRTLDVRHEAEKLTIPLESLVGFMPVSVFIDLLKKGSL